MSQEYIYFIKEEENNNVKIGVSVNPVQRLQELQTGSPYKLIMIGFIEGGADEEKNIHREFAEERIRENGEWFRPSERLTTYIKQRIETSADYHLNSYDSSSSGTNNYTNGQRTITYDNGDKYEGEIKDGKRHGQGKYTKPSGYMYEGEWKDGKTHGQGTEYTSTGKICYNGEWMNGEYHGQGTSYMIGKVWKEGFFKEGSLSDGIEYPIHPNGPKIKYVNGKRCEPVVSSWTRFWDHFF